MLRILSTFILAVLLLNSNVIFSQTYQGPSTGNVNSGVMVSTNNFSSADRGNDLTGLQYEREAMNYYSEPSICTTDMKVFDDYVYIEDVSSNLGSVNGIGTSFELQSFNSIPMTNSVPPDPHMAVGPNHVISMVNGRFHIYDRGGNLLKNISDAAWVGQVINHPIVTDPQVIYDHYANRWVMVWLTLNEAALQSSITICYSDNENAIGTWYMYALNGSVNGTTNSNAFGDYPQVGYDDLGIYITTREFFFAGGLAGAKIKILNKSQLYSANGGPLTFTDLWNIRLLNGQQTDDLHPTVSYDPGKNTAYFVIVPNSGSYYSLYKISDPVTIPVLSGINFNVPFFGAGPDAQQLGGGTPLSSGAGGSGMRNSPIIRDDSLYAVHHIRNTQYTNSTSIKYFVINLNTNNIVNQLEFGAQNFYYIYPSIAVDKDHNVAITYTRSGFTEYAGSYYSTRLVSDPQGFSPSKVMTEGKANYVNAPGGGANRWGDYLGAALDPVNQYNIWLYSEYASATNTWGTWLTEIRMVPFNGIYVYSDPSIIDTLDFGRFEIGSVSDTIDVLLSNYGIDSLVITDIPDSVGDYHLLTQLNFPIVLNTYDSLTISFNYTPTLEGKQIVEYPINNNSSIFNSITLKGFGWSIHPAINNQMYAISGAQNNGNFVSINKMTGVGSNLGLSLFTDIKSIAIKPDTNLTFGMRSNTSETEILKINAESGDSYHLLNLNIPNMYTIAFDTTGKLYGISTNKTIYKIDPYSGTYDSITSVPVMPISVAFDPTDNVLWGTYRKTSNPKDLIIKIDLTTGDTLIVGSTGFGANTIDITFDEFGNLYGIKGIGATVSDLFSINKATGIGTIIGSIGLKDIRALAYSYDDVFVGVDKLEDILPKEYILTQNYPNPFNPSTQIKFALPVNANVKITIYNLLGEVVKQLTAMDMNAGTHSVQWNADDVNGNKVSSGIYFYELNAGGVNGTNFNQVRKMMLLK